MKNTLPNHEGFSTVETYEPTSIVPSLAERIDSSTIDDPAIIEIIERERTVPVKIGIDSSLRPKILDKCGMTCNFCHNEGTPVASAHDKRTFIPFPDYGGGRVSVFERTNGVDFLPGQMMPNSEFEHALRSMMVATNATELHMTGGEPTLHRDLPELIRIAKSLGYSVKITSNGENGAQQIERCAAEGLDKINFSIFGTTPEELAAVQHSKYKNEKLAQAKLRALHRSIDTAIKFGVEVGANIVMSDYSHAERVARIIDTYGDSVSIRILNDLDAGDTSYLAIYKFLAELQAEPIELTVEAGTSNSRVKYRLLDGSEIYFKQIRRTTLPETCGDCSLNNENDCNEGYYGLRMYVDTQGQYKIGVCIQRMDLTTNIDDFLNSSVPEEILDFRESEYNQLVEYYADRPKEDAC